MGFVYACIYGLIYRTLSREQNNTRLLVDLISTVDLPVSWDQVVGTAHVSSYSYSIICNFHYLGTNIVSVVPSNKHGNLTLALGDLGYSRLV